MIFLADTLNLCSGLGEFHFSDHVYEMAMASFDIINSFNEIANLDDQNIQVRIGIHVGDCKAELSICHSIESYSSATLPKSQLYSTP